MSELEFSAVNDLQHTPQHARCNEQSEYDAAIEVAAKAIRKTWDTMGDMPSPLYEDERGNSVEQHSMPLSLRNQSFGRPHDLHQAGKHAASNDGLSMNGARAARYRRLATAQSSPEVYRLLMLLADEAEKGILCISAFKHRRPPHIVAKST